MRPEKCSNCAKFYDAEKYPSCPFCNQSAPQPVMPAAQYQPNYQTQPQKTGFRFGKKAKNNPPVNAYPPAYNQYTPPVYNNNPQVTAGESPTVALTYGESETQSPPQNYLPPEPPAEPLGVTVKLGSYEYDNFPKTVPLEKPENIQPEIPVPDKPSALRNEIEKVSPITQKAAPSDKTVAFYDTPDNTEPVAGWLVCVKGSYVGESFELYLGKNHIGRSLNMTVALAKEKTVSREKHATITFDPVAKQFFLQAGDGNGLTYLNSKLVLTPETLKIYDKITLGECSLIFIPLCCENFDWDVYLSK